MMNDSTIYRDKVPVEFGAICQMTGGSQLAGSQTSKHDIQLVGQDIAQENKFSRVRQSRHRRHEHGNQMVVPISPTWLVSNGKVISNTSISPTAVFCDVYRT